MGRRKKGDKVDGWVNLDKPLGLTSTQALAKVRKSLNAQKAGHAGTLDPLASGVLPIALGEATKTIPFAQDREKTYEFEVTWGEQRSTDDAEGEVMESSDARPSKEQIESALPQFIGEIEQIPPKFSAIKVDGERAYDLARDGQDFEIKARIVEIHTLELLKTTTDTATLKMQCGKGTYVRSLARDLAIELGTFGYVSTLKRTAVGPFKIENTISLDKLLEMDHTYAQETALLGLETSLDDIPALKLKTDETTRLKNGNEVPFIAKPDFERLNALEIEDKDIALATYDGRPVALVERRGPAIKPIRVFNL